MDVKIKTKYSIGQLLYYIDSKNKIETAVVVKYAIEILYGGVEIEGSDIVNPKEAEITRKVKIRKGRDCYLEYLEQDVENVFFTNKSDIIKHFTS